jgi:hypothetical protein
VNVNGIGSETVVETETGRGTGTGTAMIDTDGTMMAQVAEIPRGIRLGMIPRTQPQRLSQSYPRMRLSGLNKKLSMTC